MKDQTLKMHKYFVTKLLQNKKPLLKLKMEDLRFGVLEMFTLLKKLSIVLF